jgi:diaminopimelate decarboxylase
VSPAAAGSVSSRKVRYDVVGPVCESGDFFAKNRPMPPLKSGTLLAIFGAGAYGFTMSSNYNSRPRAAEVLVKGKNWYVIRKREKVEDLFRGEHIPAFLK